MQLLHCFRVRNKTLRQTTMAKNTFTVEIFLLLSCQNKCVLFISPLLGSVGNMIESNHELLEPFRVSIEETLTV